MTQKDQLSFDFIQDTQESKEQFFAVKRPWSASKHRIILKYLQSFAYILGKPTGRVNYVDAFAGAGKYDQGIGAKSILDQSNFWNKRNVVFEDTDGSPIISLKISESLQHGQENQFIKCFFAEENNKISLALRGCCSKFSDQLYKIYNPQPFESCFPSILADLDQHPTLFFLDSFGIKGLKFLTLQRIAEYIREYKGELFLLFHNQAVSRTAGQSISTTRGKEAFCENLTNFFGVGSESVWKMQWQSLRDKPQQFEQWALQYFKDNLINIAGFRSVTSFPVQESYSDVRPKYHIIFCTNFPEKAVAKILNDFIYQEEKLLYYQRSNKGNEEFLNQQWEEIKKIRFDNIISFINCKKLSLIAKNPTLDDCITQIILDLDNSDNFDSPGFLQRKYSPGFLQRKHYREILLKLIDLGELGATNLGKRGQPTLDSKLFIP